jgi:hypothetical protein
MEWYKYTSVLTTRANSTRNLRCRLLAVETLLKLGVEVLRLVPLILAFYVPALLGVAIWKERGEGYRAKAFAVFALGFGAIIAVQILFRSISAVQVAATAGLSLVQISAAIALAALTVYKLAD